MRATIRLPGSMDLKFGPITDTVSNLTAPVCELSQDKWLAPYTITDSLLSDTYKELEYAFTVEGVRERVHAFGKRIEGANRYIGCYLRRFDGQRREVHVTFVSLRYEWKHDPACNKKHRLPLPEEAVTLHGFQRPPKQPFWLVNWANVFDAKVKP